MSNPDDLLRDINFLLSQLQQKDEEIQKLRKHVNKLNYDSEKTAIELVQKENEIQKLREERDEARCKAQEAWAEIDDAEQQIISAQQEIERLRGAMAGAAHIANLGQKDLFELKQDIQKLIEGLRKYANPEAYDTSVWSMYDGWRIDGGKLARSILQEIGVEK